MGRHRSPDSTTRVSKELVIALVVIVALLLAAIAWFSLRGLTSKEHTASGKCPKGDIAVPYALIGGAEEPTQLFDDFLNTNPVVQDNCITKFDKTSTDKAAFVLTAAGNPETSDALKQAQRTPSSDSWTPARFDDIGIARPAGSSAPASEWKDAREISLLKEQPGVAALAATAMANNDAANAQKLLSSSVAQDEAVKAKRSIATRKDAIPAGYELASLSPQLSWPTRIVPLNYAGEVSEEQSRAANEFGKFVASTVNKSPESDSATLKTAQGLAAAPQTSTSNSPSPTSAHPAPAALPKDTNTLVLLDTSMNMNTAFGDRSVFQTVAPVLTDRLRTIGSAGAHVGLWNYSSPLNPGVTKSWRNNVSLADNSGGVNAANAIPVFGLGGVPNTREALISADQVATEYAKETKKPVRILLVTTGTADSAALPTDSSTVIDVVHVGTQPIDEEVKQFAESHGGSVRVVTDANQLDSALDAALGL